MPSHSQHRKTTTILRLIVSLLVIISGLALTAGGGYLAALGGSWYYVLAGLLMMVSGVELFRGNYRGTRIFYLILAGTFLWTAWESGLDYWRWVPRLDVVLALAILVVLISPSLRGGISRPASYKLAGSFGAAFLIAVGLAFLPGINFHQYAAVPAPAAATPYGTSFAGLQKSDAPDDKDWPAYGRDAAATRFSPLKQINAQNVSELKVAWQMRTGDLLSHGWGGENTPLKIGSTLYACSVHNRIIAIDAGNGSVKWTYDPVVSEGAIPSHAACRGVSYFEVPADKRDINASSPQACIRRIVYTTIDARMIELDADTGKPCSQFGNNGQIYFNDHLGNLPEGYVASHAAPVIVNDVVITGTDVIDGQSEDEPSGVIRGYNVYTGEAIWAWDATHPDHTAPLTGDEVYPRSSPNVWATAVGDNKLGLVYLPTGNGAPDYMSAQRNPGKRAYSSSVVALNAATGNVVWHFQTVHNDVWDYDLGSQPTLVDYPTSKGKVPALIIPTKQGDIYVLNRATGEPIAGGAEERPVPGGGVEPNDRAKTQPFSLFANVRSHALTARDTWGITPFDQLYCRVQFQKAQYDGIYTAPTADKPYIQYPSYNGGVDWGSISVDPQRGVLIANYSNIAMYNQLVPKHVVEKEGWKTRAEAGEGAQTSEDMNSPQQGADYGVAVNAGWRVPFTRLLCTEPPYGGIRAIDMKSGKTLWESPLGTARENGPFDIKTGLPINIGTPNNGGSVITAGGLVFIAAATDNLFRAINITSGKVVWSVPLPAGGQTIPVVYEENGKEYVLIHATGHNLMDTPMGDYVIAYALPDVK